MSDFTDYSGATLADPESGSFCFENLNTSEEGLSASEAWLPGRETHLDPYVRTRNLPAAVAAAEVALFGDAVEVRECGTLTAMLTTAVRAAARAALLAGIAELDEYFGDMDSLGAARILADRNITEQVGVALVDYALAHLARQPVSA